MSQSPSKLSLFLADLKRRRVTRLASIYAVAGLGINEAFDIIGGRFLLPEWTFKALIMVTLIGFPVVMVLGWIYDISDRRIVKTDPMTPAQQASVKLSWKPGWLSIILLCILFLMTTAFFIVPRPNALGFKQQDWILIADLENNTGDPIFDKALVHALSITLDQSRRINIYPRTQADEVLKRMRLDTVTKITLPLAREIAERENIKGVLLLTISELSETYVISTSLIDPLSGQIIRSNQVRARGKDQILSELNRLAIEVRKNLGESLQKIHMNKRPLIQATSSSLQALKYLTEAQSTTVTAGYNEKSALLLKAIELDPEFALAHSELAFIYYTTNNREQGEEHITLALNQLDRLTERERLWIEAAVEGYRGNREASVTKWNTFLTRYPGSYFGWFRLGYNLMILRQPEESIQAFSKVLEINPDADPAAMINIATCYNMMGNYQDATDYYQRAFRLNPQWETNTGINHEYGFAFVKMGDFTRARAIFSKLLDGNTYEQAQGKRSISLLLMYQGKYAEARSVMHEAVVLHGSLGYKLSELRDRLYLCKIFQAMGLEEEFQTELEHCNASVIEATTEPIMLLRVGVPLARSGKLGRSQEILEEILERSNQGNKTDEAAYYLLKGEIELAKGNYKDALLQLENAIALDENVYNLESLARYYVVVEDWPRVIGTCEKMINDKSALGWEGQESWIRAHFDLITACRETGDSLKARQTEEQILEIWVEADEGLTDLLGI